MPLDKNEADSLWESLLALASGGKKDAPVLGRVKNAAAKVARSQVRKATRASWKWTDEELILIIHEDTCACCGHTFQWPNPAPLLKRTHPKLGTHYTALEEKPGTDPEHTQITLPQRIEYVFGHAQACQHCFGIEKAVARARTETPEAEAPATPAEIQS